MSKKSKRKERRLEQERNSDLFKKHEEFRKLYSEALADYIDKHFAEIAEIVWGDKK